MVKLVSSHCVLTFNLMKIKVTLSGYLFYLYQQTGYKTKYKQSINLISFHWYKMAVIM